MISKTVSASLLAALFLTTPAFAEETTVGRPIEGGSLHAGRLDMAVYYVPVDGNILEVTATFAPKGGGDPLRVVMGLADGDSVAFSMLGQQDSPDMAGALRPKTDARAVIQPEAATFRLFRQNVLVLP
jgi:hypothetical protein